MIILNFDHSSSVSMSRAIVSSSYFGVGAVILRACSYLSIAEKFARRSFASLRMTALSLRGNVNSPYYFLIIVPQFSRLFFAFLNPKFFSKRFMRSCLHHILNRFWRWCDCIVKIIKFKLHKLSS